MEIKIIKDTDKIAFQGKISSLDELKVIFNSIKKQDSEFGFSFSYQIEGIQDLITKELQNLEHNRLNNVLKQQGYISLADIYFYAQNNDNEAQQILNWYSNANGNGYDDLVWDWIDNTLPTYQAIDELLNLDLKQIEEDIFNQSVQNNPLP